MTLLSQLVNRALAAPLVSFCIGGQRRCPNPPTTVVESPRTGNRYGFCQQHSPNADELARMLDETTEGAR